jgi:hypothetical protein
MLNPTVNLATLGCPRVNIRTLAERDMDDRSPLRKAVIKVASLLGVVILVVCARAWRQREPPKIRDVAGRAWYFQRGENAAGVAPVLCSALDGRAAYLDGPYADRFAVSFCCGPPNTSSTSCDRP